MPAQPSSIPTPKKTFASIKKLALKNKCIVRRNSAIENHQIVLNRGSYSDGVSVSAANFYTHE
jgi:hypothetical protein